MADFAFVFTTDRECPACDSPFYQLTSHIGEGHSVRCGANGHEFPASHKDDPAGDDEIRFEYHIVGGGSNG